MINHSDVSGNGKGLQVNLLSNKIMHTQLWTGWIFNKKCKAFFERCNKFDI